MANESPGKGIRMLTRVLIQIVPSGLMLPKGIDMRDYLSDRQAWVKECYHALGCESCRHDDVCKQGRVPTEDLLVVNGNRGNCWRPKGCLLVFDEVEV